MRRTNDIPIMFYASGGFWFSFRIGPKAEEDIAQAKKLGYKGN